MLIRDAFLTLYLPFVKGQSVIVYDVQPDAVSKLTDAGAHAGHSPAEVAEKSDTLISMLPTNSHVLDVYAGKDGILKLVI